MPASLLLALLSAVALTAPGAAEEPAWTVEDRILASVDGDPILASDVERALRLGLGDPAPEGEAEDAKRRRVLEALIDERLRFHEVDRYGLARAPAEEVERRLEQTRSGFASDEEYRAWLAGLDLTEEGLGQLIARQIVLLTYVEDRLSARVLVTLDDVRAYYEQKLVPALVERQAEVPPLEEVREAVRAVLREERLNREIERWTEELEAKADVVRLPLDRARPLPPLVEVLTPPPAKPPG
ncbi:MAG TPA: SurA N-terminal domain-containing protein [Thermoanaerobaculia bacterium]|nr:SurA N-terminal domain-containing protein [Thermoanaerobaculia bacterium]